MSEEERPYRPKDAIQDTIKTTLVLGSAGLLLAAVQNTLNRQNIGPFGVFTKFGGTIGVFAAVGGTYAFVRAASANLREKEDTFNATLAGFCAGSVLGLKFRKMSSVVGCGVLVAVTLGLAEYTGNTMLSDTRNLESDLFLSKTELRHRFRRPINETINELGEGRGIYGPGYEERRRRRIKENYGIDVPDFPKAT